MINNIVGSANAKFEKDFLSQLKSKKQQPLSSRLASFIFKNHCQQLNNETDMPDFDFKLVKISCKKEAEYDSHTLLSARLKWILESILLVLFCLLFIFCILVIFGLSGNGESLLRTRRSVNIYSSDKLEEWSSQNIPSIYETDLFELIGKELDSDKKTIHEKLSHIKTALKFNCIQLRNVNKAYGLSFKDFFGSTNEQVYEKDMKRLGAMRNLLEIAHELLMRVIFEIDFEVGSLTADSMFINSKDTNVYLIRNTTGNESLDTEWKYSDLLGMFYLTQKTNTEFAYFNISNTNVQNAYKNMLKFWSASLDSDGIYMKNFNQIAHDSSPTADAFIVDLKAQTTAIPVFTLIGDFTPDTTLNHLYDFYRVDLDASALFTSLQNTSFDPNPLEMHLKGEKKIVWSLANTKIGDTSMLLDLFLSFSLPGFPLIRQSHELASYTNTANPVVDFIKLFNQVVKPKLNDYKPEKPVTTAAPPFTTKNPRPEPFKDQGYTSLVDAYLPEYTNYDISSQFGKVLRITRQIDNYRDMHRHTNRFYAAKFYRNVVFYVNLSPFNIAIDQLIRVPRSFTGAYLNRSPFHVLYDSSKLLPEFLKVDGRNKMHSHYLMKNQTLAIEF